jgi:hypothetical protein
MKGYGVFCQHCHHEVTKIPEPPYPPWLLECACRCHEPWKIVHRVMSDGRSALVQRVRERMEREGIPIGTDDPTLLAMGATRVEAT